MESRNEPGAANRTVEAALSASSQRMGEAAAPKDLADYPGEEHLWTGLISPEEPSPACASRVACFCVRSQRVAAPGRRAGVGTHRCGGRLRDGAVVVLLEVNVQLDDPVSVRDKQQLSAEPGCGHPVSLLQRLPTGRAAHSLAGAAHECPLKLLSGTWKKLKSATDCEGKRDTVLKFLLKKGLGTWKLLWGCSLCFSQLPWLV